MSNALKKIIFIVNPVSGSGNKEHIIDQVEQIIDKEKYSVGIEITKYPGQAHEISKKVAGNYYMVVAVGGDGTVNEVCSGLVNSKTALAIVPSGSGNGLARHLGVPLKTKKVLQLINNHTIKKIDTVGSDGWFFVSMAGIGFDAHVAHCFASHKKRGFLSYLKIITAEFMKYKTTEYSVTIDGKTFKEEAFLISFANSSQFGNGAQIAPKAIIDDGLIDVVFFGKYPKILSPVIASRLYMKSMDRSKYIKVVRGKNIRLNNEAQGHIDGEPIIFKENTCLDIKPLSLNVVVSNNKNG